MITEAKILAALAEGPMTINRLLKRVNSSSHDELHVMLMRMRDAGHVKFNIKSGHWSIPKAKGD